MSGAALHDFHTADNTLEVRHLRTRFFTREGELPAVEDVSLTLARGRVLGLVGESGSGKSVTGIFGSTVIFSSPRKSAWRDGWT